MTRKGGLRLGKASDWWRTQDILLNIGGCTGTNTNNSVSYIGEILEMTALKEGN